MSTPDDERAPAGEPLRDLRLAVLGCGAAGSAFARALSRAGARLSLWSRDPERARALAQDVARAEPAAELAQALTGVAGALLCVTDDALPGFAERCAGALPDFAGGEKPVALHTNGALGAEVLAPLARAGWGTGSLHPLVSLPPRAAGEAGGPGPTLSGAWFASSGDGPARALARRLVEALGGHELALRDEPGAAARYHAGAALLAGGVAVLFEAALHLLVGASRDAGEAKSALAGLLESGAANLSALEPRDALTGPAARGAAGVVARHLEALAEDPDALELYRVLGRRMLELAAQRGSLNAAERRRLEELLAG